MKKRSRGISTKKKGKKKGRRKKKKAKPEFLQYVNDVPKYEDPDVVSPTVELFITLFDNICKDHYEKRVMMKTNKKAREILKIIKEMHQGAIGNVKITREKFVEGAYLDMDKTLHENGISEPGTYNIIYDYEPVKCPLLDF